MAVCFWTKATKMEIDKQTVDSPEWKHAVESLGHGRCGRDGKSPSEQRRMNRENPLCRFLCRLQILFNFFHCKEYRIIKNPSIRFHNALSQRLLFILKCHEFPQCFHSFESKTLLYEKSNCQVLFSQFISQTNQLLISQI